MEEHRRSDKRLWLGFAFIIIGGLWLLDNLNIMPFIIPSFLISWKTFLILLGVYFIVAREKMVPGVVLIAVGGIFLLEDLDILDAWNFWQLFWPGLIIFAGVYLIMRRGNRRGESGEEGYSVDYIDDFALFGGRGITVNSQDFKGGKVTALFGGSEIDLRNADLHPGTKVVDIFAMFGGTTLIVPPEWTIHIDVVSLLGGFGDNRASALKVVPNKDKLLVIKGFVMFGGGEIKLNK